MRILLSEYITGGGMADAELPYDMVQEGRLMAHALAMDLLYIAGVQLSIPWDARLPLPPYASNARVTIHPVVSSSSFRSAWQVALMECDAVWPIAPESGGLLAALCREVETAGRVLFNSPATAVALASSKGDTAGRLAGHGIAVAPSYRMCQQPDNMPWPRVVKPDDGAGCCGVFWVEGAAQWEQRCEGLQPGAYLVQPYIEGPALSLSALFWRGSAVLLSVNRQRVEVLADGGFRLTGCEVGAVPDENGIYTALARRIANAVPELQGYAGIDFILGAEGPVVLEINPRLTTSYAALGQLLQRNPAALVLEVFETGHLPPPMAPAVPMVSLAW